MLFEFLRKNEAELITRCRNKVLVRRVPRTTDAELEHGIPLFLSQLIDTLAAHEKVTPAPMVRTATRHGGDMKRMGFTVAQVVHDYGDLCQSISELATERDSAITPREFGVLNRCLDDAIAGAMTEYSRPREGYMTDRRDGVATVWLGSVATDVRERIDTALVSFDAMKRGSVPVNGATGALHDRSLRELRRLIDHSLMELRLSTGMRPTKVALSTFIADVESAAALDAHALGVQLTTTPVDHSLTVHVDGAVMATVLANLLQNAFKYTAQHGKRDVRLRVRSSASRVWIDVEDECGGLPAGATDELFWPYADRTASTRGGEPGLAVYRKSVEANSGTLTVQNLLHRGCVFTIELPTIASSAEKPDVWKRGTPTVPFGEKQRRVAARKK